jgi:hypothetical protein
VAGRHRSRSSSQAVVGTFRRPDTASTRASGTVALRVGCALHALLLGKARLEPAVALSDARLARLRAVCSRALASARRFVLFAGCSRDRGSGGAQAE